ncbi:hypothetical protein KQI84_08810 [bacterium]|nr:hypothetical protein [bacterium]
MKRPSSNALVFAGLAIGLAALSFVLVRDKDFGFHLATGRFFFEHGIPRHEFLAPLLADQPWASQWLLGSIFLTVAWKIAGPAGLEILKLIGYGGGFLLAVEAARRRGVETWRAGLWGAIAAAGVSARMVERPGLFSALFLGGLCLLAVTPAVIDFVRSKPVRSAAIVAVGSTVWSWTHPEWYVGLAALGCLLRSRDVPWRQTLIVGFTALLVPWLSFAILHPAGLIGVLGPLILPFTATGEFQTAEFALVSWQTMPLGLLVVALTVAALARRAVQGDRWEALLLAILLLLTLKVPRSVLPLAIVGLPAVGELFQAIPFPKLERPARRDFLAGVGCVAICVAAVAFSPWMRPGFGWDPEIDCRGVGDVLAQIDDHEGPIFASYGWASLLLSQPGAVRQGVLMDGRQEAYTPEYLRKEYLPLLDPQPGWSDRLNASPAMFYYEPFIGPTLRAMAQAQAAGWQIIAWDNSGRLAARPGIATRHGLRTYEVDPLNVDAAPATPAALQELASRCDELETAGYPSVHGRLAQAQLAMRMGRLEAVAQSLANARTQGGERFVSYWMVFGNYALATDQPAIIPDVIRELEALDALGPALVLQAQVALQRGDRERATELLRKAAEHDPRLAPMLEHQAQMLSE